MVNIYESLIFDVFTGSGVKGIEGYVALSMCIDPQADRGGQKVLRLVQRAVS